MLLLAVLLADEDTADVRLADCSRAEGSRVGQNSLQELERNYLLASYMMGLMEVIPTSSRHLR